MITTAPPVHVVKCDTCGEIVSSEAGTRYRDFIDQIAADGWKFIHAPGATRHNCPDCIALEVQNHGV